MLNPHLLMAVFYLSLAVVATVGSALIGAGLLPAFGALSWVRVHFITLGTATQLMFAALPSLVAAHRAQPRPAIRWDIWAVYNAGLVALLIGIPLVQRVPIFVGGMLVLVAVTLLVLRLRGLARGQGGSCALQARFYGASLLYLLLGAFLGTGLWLNWATWLRLSMPKEVHVHSNLWGFSSLVLAGLVLGILADRAPAATPRPRWAAATFWLMVVGALALVLGPWLGVRLFDVGGVVMHTVGTLLLVIGAARTLRAAGQLWQPGSLQLLGPYLWLLVVVALSPIVVFGSDAATAAAIESEGPLLLIYGWLLPIILAVLPYMLERALHPDHPARLGGTWLSVGAGHVGTLLYAASVFLAGARGPLQAAAFVAWAVALLPIAARSWSLVQQGSGRVARLTAGRRHPARPFVRRARPGLANPAGSPAGSAQETA